MLSFNSTRWISNIHIYNTGIVADFVSTPHGGLATKEGTERLVERLVEVSQVSTPHGGLATLLEVSQKKEPEVFQLHTVD